MSATTRSNEVLAGTFLLLMFVSSIIAVAFAGAVGTDYNVSSNEVPEVMRLVAGNLLMHQMEIAFDLISFILLVALSGVMYLVFAPHGKLAAILGSYFLAAGGVILAVHDAFWFVFPSISVEFVLASGVRAEMLSDMGLALMLTANWTLSIGIAFMGIGILLFGLLMIRSRAVPQWQGWIGVLAGALLLTGTWLPRVDPELYVLWTILSAPVLVWEVSLGVRLLRKGVQAA